MVADGCLDCWERVHTCSGAFSVDKLTKCNATRILNLLVQGVSGHVFLAVLILFLNLCVWGLVMYVLLES